MQTKAATLALLIIASSLAGCTTSNDAQTTNHDSRITELEASQLELTLVLAEQEQTNSDLLASISQIESANMQAIQTLESDYQESLTELESSYLAAMEAAAIVNSQSLEEINATNAASINNLLISLNTLQSNLLNSQDSIEQISLIVEALDEILLESVRVFVTALQNWVYPLEEYKYLNDQVLMEKHICDSEMNSGFEPENGLSKEIVISQRAAKNWWLN